MRSVIALTLLLVGCGGDLASNPNQQVDSGAPDTQEPINHPSEGPSKTGLKETGSKERDGGTEVPDSGSSQDSGSLIQDSGLEPQDSGHPATQDSGSPDSGSTDPDSGSTPAQDSGSPTPQDSGTVTNPSCSAGDATCYNDQILTCTNGQWQAGLTCQYGCTAGKCNPCEPEALRCNGLDVEVCDGQNWLTAQQCNYLCQNSACVEKVCEPGTVVCKAGQTGQQCNQLGTAWEPATSCQGACKSGTGDCNNSPADGCETGTNTTNNCGGCGISCNAPGAASYCSNGSCGFSCLTGKADCDKQAANGCEATPATDVNNCGGCGNVCSSSGGAPSCNNGTCSIQCDSTHANCDGNLANGCETSLTAMNNCGGCGITCNAGTEICQAGACTKNTTSCASGTGDCDGNSTCETTLTTVTNCGACGVQCATYPNMATSCNGSCQYTCNAGYANVDGSLSNGCEVNLKTDANNCGTVGNICSSSGGSASCSNGTCNLTCFPGRANCDGKASNGCEVNTTSDVGNCGACGSTCGIESNATSMCSASICSTTCQPGWADCDGKTGNGCEQNTTNDVNHCGGCGTVCLGDTNQCNSGQCQYNVTEMYAGSKATNTASMEYIDAIASDAVNVYLSSRVKTNGTWTTRIRQVAKVGGQSTTLSTVTLGVTKIVLRNNYLFWGGLDNSSGSLVERIFKTDLSNNTSTEIVTDVRGNYNPVSNFVVDDNYVYWLSNESTVSPTDASNNEITSTTIYRVSVNGGAKTTYTTISEAAIGWADQTFASLSGSPLFVATWGTKDANQSPPYNYSNQGVWMVPTAVSPSNKSRIVGGQVSISRISAVTTDLGRSIVWIGQNGAHSNGGVWSYQQDGSYLNVVAVLQNALFTDGTMVVTTGATPYTVAVDGGAVTQAAPTSNSRGVTTADSDNLVWVELATDHYVVRFAPRT